MEKSFVTLEQHRCLVCGHDYDTGALLLDKHMRNKFNRNTLTGNGLCPEHRKLYDDGYIALVECDREKSLIEGEMLKPEDAYRTGNIAHVRRTVANDIFNVKLPDKIPMVFVEPGVIEKLKEAMQAEE